MELAEDMKHKRKDCKIINNFLAELPDLPNHFMQITDLEKLIGSQQIE